MLQSENKKTEYLGIYDENKRYTGECFARGNQPPQGYYLVVQVIFFNSEGKMLIQQRQSTKEAWPDIWDVSCGGAVMDGESSQQAAMRECREELGVRVDLSGIRPRVCSSFPQGYTDVYIVEQDLAEQDLVLQEEEVQDATYASEQEILAMIDEGSFFPYLKSWISYLFESRKEYGSFRI